ncbi:hypothetical protein LZP73_05710 [Shewanella sp. AS16]|uniref:HAD family hydrolase n=1 Tax=Shewanella sp. AS16 TaxID=2907625 RepID=UPI001F2823EF|nr:hypothetical protein [Shewanella sp. AS16]MCE9685712.1 hypothetical protein [Shewanella sp. AS16]
MIEITIPGFTSLTLQHLVSDYNGTLAADGKLLPGVAELFEKLAPEIQIHVITADTFGLAQSQLAGLPVTLEIIPLERQAEAKLAVIERLGADSVFAVGNGANDRLMLGRAAVGVALLQKEGVAAATLASADLVSGNIVDALELLQHPKRLIATLRA